MREGLPCAKEKALASLSHFAAWGGCCQADFNQGHRFLPFTLQSGTGEHRQLCATCTWQHVIEAGAGFGVAQQRLWSEDYQLEWGIRSRARWSALPETPPCKPVLEQTACPPLPILSKQGHNWPGRFASHSAAVLCWIGHPFPIAPTIPVRMSVPWGRGGGATRDFHVLWLELTRSG